MLVNKRISALLICLAFCVSLCACGRSDDINNTQTTEQTTQLYQESTTEETKPSETTEKPAETTTKATVKNETTKAVVLTTKANAITKVEEIPKTTVTYKYGTKITTIENSSSYDYSTFNVTTQQIKPEAVSVCSKRTNEMNAVLANTNSYRAEVGAQPLSLDDDLCVAATIRAIEMAWSNVFSHTRPDGRECFSIFEDMNISYSAVGENIAKGYFTADSVSEGWKGSSGHYKNMINTKFNKLGVGCYELSGNYYWVQLFKD
ncbi:MAG: CAP domain-containing protein [Clostridiales bacterium]|nr:CAP domain-containing protein [Clostridiales bacterium]